jgi:Reverse transcriptase (RNA-dependent DNA polymerase)
MNPQEFGKSGINWLRNMTLMRYFLTAFVMLILQLSLPIILTIFIKNWIARIMLTCDHSVYKAADYSLCFYITVQQIDSCLRELHLHKASGPDHLAGEHLVYAHPSLIIHLRLLFSLIVVHGFVPDWFGQGIIVPLVKDKSISINNISKNRPITLTPVISKVFETLLMSICKCKVATSDLQYGFKKGIGCPNVTFSVKTVVNHFIELGSSVYAAMLDLRKAFDSVNLSKLYDALLQAGIPLTIVDMSRY